MHLLRREDGGKEVALEQLDKEEFCAEEFCAGQRLACLWSLT